MGASILRIPLAQRGIAPLITAEQADDRSRTQSHSTVWGNQMEMNRLFFIRSARRIENRGSIRLDSADRMSALTPVAP